MIACLEKARVGLNLVKEAVVDFINDNPKGVSNTEVARALELESDFEGEQKNYLSWAVLGLLVNEGRIRYERKGRGRVYFPVTQSGKAE